MVATLVQFETLKALITRALPSAIGGLDIDQIIRLAEANNGNLSAKLYFALSSFIEQSEHVRYLGLQDEPMNIISHEVNFRFTLEGEKFETVDFKWTGERPPTREEAIYVADTDSLVLRSDEQWKHVYKCRRDLPRQLEGYVLFSAFGRSEISPDVCNLTYQNRWYEGRSNLGWLHEGDLILRRGT